MDPHSRAPGPALSARFQPSWDFIEPLRLSVEAFARAIPRLSDRVGIVTQELLENAVKYGNPSSEIEFALELDASNPQRWMEVRVANCAHRSRIVILEKELARIGGSSTAHAAFAKAFDRLRRMPQGSSMLGLARIATEATIGLDIKEDRVLITARIA